MTSTTVFVLNSKKEVAGAETTKACLHCRKRLPLQDLTFPSMGYTVSESQYIDLQEEFLT